MEQYKINALKKVKRELNNMYELYSYRSIDATEEDNKECDFIQDIYLAIESVIDMRL